MMLPTPDGREGGRRLKRRNRGDGGDGVLMGRKGRESDGKQMSHGIEKGKNRKGKKTPII